MRHSDCIAASNHRKYDQLRTGSAAQGAAGCKNHEIHIHGAAMQNSINDIQTTHRFCVLIPSRSSAYGSTNPKTQRTESHLLQRNYT